ncbi:unnamed protein product [Ranitomeya imitator]|uniref:WH2 domain-containing protein n=1 Tax=Ranitomeya imitator TaxID=111125 RepID=A0ABN9M6R3_9NEOB|nr:unnamed protein product [Ranitomeya imitator]
MILNTRQNNDPKHTSKSTIDYLKSHKLKVLQRPSQSPGLNIIENQWQDLKIAVHARRPRNITELEEFSKEEWMTTPQRRIESPLIGFKKRLQAATLAKGGATRTPALSIFTCSLCGSVFSTDAQQRARIDYVTVPSNLSGRSAPPKLKQETGGGGGGGRSALLSDIQKGARLKKVTEVNDRSAPVIHKFGLFSLARNTSVSRMWKRSSGVGTVERSVRPHSNTWSRTLRSGVPAPELRFHMRDTDVFLANAKKNGGTGNSRSAVAPPTGGLFAGGFPVLKPSNKRDATGNKSAPQLPGIKGSVPKLPDQVPPKTDHPKPIPHTVAARPPPPRPTILGRLSPVPPPIPQAPHPIPQVPPPIPPSSSKPQLMPSSPIPSTFKERPAKPTGGSNGPPSPVNCQDKSKLQRPQSQFFPSTPPPLPPYPPPTLPPGYPGRRSPSPSVPDGRDHSGLPPPPLPSVPSRLEDFIPPPPDIRDLPPPPPPPPHPSNVNVYQAQII